MQRRLPVNAEVHAANLVALPVEFRLPPRNAVFRIANDHLALGIIPDAAGLPVVAIVGHSANCVPGHHCRTAIGAEEPLAHLVSPLVELRIPSGVPFL